MYTHTRYVIIYHLDKSCCVLCTFCCSRHCNCVLQVGGNVTSVNVTALIPHTVYSFSVAACTVIGCTVSNATSPITTLTDGQCL